MKYTIIKQLHDGNDGPVYLVKLNNGEICVLKKYRYLPNEFIKNNLITELIILSNIQGYSNLLQLIDITNEIGEYNIFTELLVNDLNDLIKKKPKPPAICKYMFQILTGLFNLHQLGIIHNDLRPSNILYDKNYDLKIIDFGNSYFIQYPYKNIPNIRAMENYTPPEYSEHRNIGRISVNSDIYSAGIIFWNLIDPIGYIKRHKNNYLYNFIFDINTIDWKIVKNIVGTKGKLLLKQMLDFDPEKRITSLEAIHHPYFNSLKTISNQDKSSRKLIGGSFDEQRKWEITRLMTKNEWLKPTNGDMFLPLIIKNNIKFVKKYKIKKVNILNKKLINDFANNFLNSNLEFITMKYCLLLVYLFLNKYNNYINKKVLLESCLNLAINIIEYDSNEHYTVKNSFNIAPTPELIATENLILQTLNYNLPIPLLITDDAIVYKKFLDIIYKNDNKPKHVYHDYFLLQLKSLTKLF